MTSNTSNNSTSIPHTAPTTNLTATNSSAHSRTTSLSSGQTSSQAAVTASAPAQRPVSYARVAQPAIAITPSKPPVIAATPSSTVIGGAPVQNVRPSSTASPPVNGKIPPAVANSGAGIANGAPSTYVGQHSRKSSIASGVRGPVMPNGTPRPNISFGTLNEPGTAPSSGPAVAANNPSLAAPVVPNPRASSPQPPTSAGSQPAASGGAPPQAPATSSRGNIQFGDAIQVGFQVPSCPNCPKFCPDKGFKIEPWPEACGGASSSSRLYAWS
jgi:translation initiation factor 4G